jgi:hydroxymethylbilane synthase
VIHLKAAARNSPLSLVQVKEVLAELKDVSFTVLSRPSKGDLDLNTSLRSLDKTDFFTYEMDQMVLSGECRIAIHSAKDLPEPLTEGLQIVAITRGLDPGDSLVMREEECFDLLPSGAKIATCSLRREEAVKGLRDDLTFIDLRGTIHKRLEVLDTFEADGVVVAECALERLGLTHLNRIRIPGPPLSMQGRLAVVSRKNDGEMEELFRPLNSELMPKALYLGPTFPKYAFREKNIHHCPLIFAKPLPISLENWDQFTHVILTSKEAIQLLMAKLRKRQLKLASKTIITIGKGSSEVLKAYGMSPLVPEQETAEGVAKIIKQVSDKNPYFFWPHSAKARPMIKEALIQKGHAYFAPVLYETTLDPKAKLPDLTDFQEVLFSSPSTVDAFFGLMPNPPSHLIFTPIGPVTAQALEKRCCGAINNQESRSHNNH